MMGQQREREEVLGAVRAFLSDRANDLIDEQEASAEVREPPSDERERNPDLGDRAIHEEES
jgi:hypothetical protein